jgi:hypothetical protein
MHTPNLIYLEYILRYNFVEMLETRRVFKRVVGNLLFSISLSFPKKKVCGNVQNQINRNTLSAFGSSLKLNAFPIVLINRFSIFNDLEMVIPPLFYFLFYMIYHPN